MLPSLVLLPVALAATAACPRDGFFAGQTAFAADRFTLESVRNDNDEYLFFAGTRHARAWRKLSEKSAHACVDGQRYEADLQGASGPARGYFYKLSRAASDAFATRFAVERSDRVPLGAGLRATFRQRETSAAGEQIIVDIELRNEGAEPIYLASSFWCSVELAAQPQARAEGGAPEGLYPPPVLLPGESMRRRHDVRHWSSLQELGAGTHQIHGRVECKLTRSSAPSDDPSTKWDFSHDEDFPVTVAPAIALPAAGSEKVEWSRAVDLDGDGKPEKITLSSARSEACAEEGTCVARLTIGGATQAVPILATDPMYAGIVVRVIQLQGHGKRQQLLLRQRSADLEDPPYVFAVVSWDGTRIRYHRLWQSSGFNTGRVVIPKDSTLSVIYDNCPDTETATYYLRGWELIEHTRTRVRRRDPSTCAG